MKVGLYAAGIAAFAMTACGGGALQKPANYNTGSSAPPTAETTSAPGSADSSGAYSGRTSHASTSAPRPYRHVERRRRRATNERPGLGTKFGENVYSRVTTRPFVRRSSRPFATALIHYNDAEGVQAHAAYRGGARPIPILAYTPRNEISISLTDQYGRTLPGIKANGRTLVMGQSGQRYKIVIRNRTNGRFEIVTSVDGLDVIDGRPANVHKRGYILPPHGRLVIDGFRRSDAYVAAFRFGSVRNSYAARKGRGRNVGVIGVALFDERGSVWTAAELHKRDTANPFPGNNYAQPPRY